MKILLIGPQGSGKSTQADFIAKDLRLPKISTGDIFRELAKQDSIEARKIREIQNSGRLIDDETTADIAKKRLQENDCQNGFILDGYPRNIRQVELFDPGLDKVIYLRVPDTEVIRRLMARGREDDTPEGIKTRLDLYNEQTRPLLEHYKKLGILAEINGTGDIQRIQDEIKKSI